MAQYKIYVITVKKSCKQFKHRKQDCASLVSDLIIDQLFNLLGGESISLRNAIDAFDFYKNAQVIS